MPIPFHDDESLEELGSAAFLHVEAPAPDSAQRFGALLLLNARGEPLEFVCNRIELLSDVLWRPADRQRAAVRRLSASLFRAASLSPALLLCHAGAVDAEVFGTGGQLQLSIPVGRLAVGSEAAAGGWQSVETPDADGVAQTLGMHWATQPPDHSAAYLFARLAERGLLLEPFGRAALGLREVYGEPLGSRDL